MTKQELEKQLGIPFYIINSLCDILKGADFTEDQIVAIISCIALCRRDL